MELEEMFVPIPFFETYAVSNYGTVIHLESGFELGTWLSSGHNKVKVRIGVLGAYVDFFVENLVAQAFFVNYEPGIRIFHKNGNVEDCTVLNLTFDPRYGEDETHNSRGTA